MTEKIKNNEKHKFTLTEKGMYDDLYGKGTKPTGFELPNWLKKKKKWKKA